MENLTAAVAAYAAKWKLWETGNRILVACSGGPDSMTLLSVLLDIADTYGAGLQIYAAHYNHGIRGEAADEDAAYVKAFCKEKGIPCFTEKGNVPAYAGEMHLSLETAARKLRYDFLYRVAKNIDAAAIAVAHQADDQAETVMMRILRGTGVDGLAAIRPKSGLLIRPLLFVTRSEVEAYCEKKALLPRHDVTNDVADATRNRMRLELLPQLRNDYNPSIREVLCRLAAIAADEADFLEEMVQRVWHEVVRRENDAYIQLLSEELLKEPRALRMAVLRKAVRQLGGQMDFSYVQYEAVERLFHKGNTGKLIQLPGEISARAASDRVVLFRGEEPSAEWKERSLRVPGITRIEELGLSIIARAAEAEEAVQGRLQILVNAECLRGAKVRPRNNGDRFVLGTGTQTVKKLLIDRKVPRENRGEIPVITAGDEILWVAGIRQSDTGRVESGKDAVVLQLKYDKLPEWLK